ncbi:MAG TPA: LCP family protein [Solirubrobacteraceae bacterium]|nr:LCP family protein [Solirubrobacteraceae bacterium]
MRFLRPRSTGGLALRFFLLALLVVGSVAATTAVAGLLQVQNLVNDISFNRAIKSDQIKVPAAGAPQTVLLIGSDHRVGESFHKANTDTMLLVHLDSASTTINVMSLPRDLQVNIPGYGTNKLNAAYSFGGWNLLIKTIKQNVFPQFVPNHIIDVNFSGFADLVNAIGCVYSDVDHRYYNQSQPAPSPDNYASINIEPGYQRLCGGNNQTNGALSFVRFRHTDTDLTREARQQDFIRWAKSQYPITRLLANRDRLLRIFGKHSQSDAQLHSLDGLLKVFDLVANMEGHGATIKQIPYPATLLPCTTACYVGSKSPQAVKAVWREFLRATPPPKAKPKRAAAPHRKHHAHKLSTAGLTADPADGRAQAGALRHPGMAVYYPRLIDAGSIYCSSVTGNCNNPDEVATAYAHSYPRSYPINAPGHKRYHAYRMTLLLNPGNYEDQYYGVQGTTWNDPPILSSPAGTKVVNGRTLFLYKDGSRLTQVAWHHNGDAYWISNNLTENISNAKMLEIAASLTRYNG